MSSKKKKTNYTDNYQTPTFLVICLSTHLASQVVLMVKSPPASARDIRDMGSIPGLGRSPGWEDPLGEGMATHASILAWRTAWTEEPGALCP